MLFIFGDSSAALAGLELAVYTRLSLSSALECWTKHFPPPFFFSFCILFVTMSYYIALAGLAVFHFLFKNSLVVYGSVCHRVQVERRGLV